MNLFPFFRQKLLSEQVNTTLLWLFICAAILIFSGIGLRAPWPPDEPRFANIAREMVETGQWFFPLRGGELYPDKPPIFMWTIAFIYWLTGNLNLAALLPNALCSLITVIAVFDLGRRIWGLEVGRNAALLLLITPQFLIQAKFAQIDAMLVCWTTLGCYGLLRHFFIAPAWRWYYAAWAFMGLGIITKGVGFLPAFLFLLIVIYHFFYQRLAAGFSKWVWLGPLVMVATIMLWLGPMLWLVAHSNNAELIEYKNNILFKQTGERYVDPWGHIKPWYYIFISVVPVFWLPGSLLVLTQLKNIWQKCLRDPRILVLFGWIICVLVFFSISPGKRGVYILPALPIFCLAVAAGWSGLKLNRAGSMMLRALVAFITLVVAVTALLAWQNNPKLLAKLGDYNQPFMLVERLAMMLMVMTIALAGLQLLSRRYSAWYSYGGMTAMLTLCASFFINPIISPLRTPEQLMQNVAIQVGAGELGIIRFKEQFLLFSPVKITHFSYFATDAEQFGNAWFWMNEADNRFIMAPDDITVRCFDKEKAVVVGVAHRQQWLLFDSASMQALCSEPEKIIRFNSPAALAYGREQ